MQFLTKDGLQASVDEYKRQRDCSQADVVRATGAIMALDHLIKVSYPEPPPAPPAPEVAPEKTIQ